MAPKGKAKPLFEKVVGSICGVQYTLYENGLLKVGTAADRSTTRLKAGADVDAAVRRLAGLPPPAEPSAEPPAALYEQPLAEQPAPDVSEPASKRTRTDEVTSSDAAADVIAAGAAKTVSPTYQLPCSCAM